MIELEFEFNLYLAFFDFSSFTDLVKNFLVSCHHFSLPFSFLTGLAQGFLVSYHHFSLLPFSFFWDEDDLCDLVMILYLLWLMERKEDPVVPDPDEDPDIINEPDPKKKEEKIARAKELKKQIERLDLLTDVLTALVAIFSMAIRGRPW